MNKPLSYLQYFKGNSKKVLSLLLTIVFSILLIGSIHMFLVNSIYMGKMTSFQYDYFTRIDTNGKTLDETIQNKLEIDRIIYVKSDFIPYQGMAINSSGEIIFADRDDIIYMMKLLKIEFDEDHVPENDTNELLLDKKLFVNNDYQFGQEIMTSTKLTVAQSFQSDYLIGFVPMSHEKIKTFENDTTNERNVGYLAVPIDDALENMNQYLKENLDASINIYDKDYWDSVVINVIGDVEYLFNIITVIVLISMGIGLGISTYVHYFQRRKEFGVLSSLGYSDKAILFRINKEIFYTSLCAFIISVIILILEKNIINSFLLDPVGVPGFILDFDLFTRIIVIPLFISVFSLVPTWVLLRKIDSVSIIEGEI